MQTMLFCLGGRDLEMVEIARLVEDHPTAAVIDAGLGWDKARASAYQAEIEAALARDMAVFLVELRNDLAAEIAEACHWIDHHGARAGAGAPTSIEQVFKALGLPARDWSRRLQAVAANDRGWIPELRSLGFSEDEIRALRAEDRRVQGTTPAEDELGRLAFEQMQMLHDGGLLLARLPHGRTATVADRLALATPAGEPVPNLLIISPAEINFSGDGRIVQALARAHAASWSGGALPARGFWGSATPPAKEEQVIEIIGEILGD